MTPTAGSDGHAAAMTASRRRRSVTVSYTSATFADANVGVGKPVTVNGIASAAAAAGNYNLL